MAFDFGMLSFCRMMGVVVKPCLQSSAYIFRHLIELKNSIAVLPVSNPWIPTSMIIVLVLKRNNTPVVDRKARSGRTKQKVRNNVMSGILNCAYNF